MNESERTPVRVSCPDCGWPLRGELHNVRLTVRLSPDAKAHLLEHSSGIGLDDAWLSVSSTPPAQTHRGAGR